MKGDVKLRYCLIGGDLHEVSDFAHLTPKQRPSSSCPECGSSLILKLGNSGKVAYHAAHKAENHSCSLTNSEGALHFNTKAYIFEQLKKGTKLFIKQICSGWALPGYKPHCRWKVSRPYLWLEDWDKVELEKNVRNRRPDIVLYRNSQPIAAIEICVSHALDEEKKNELREFSLPWIEVKAEGDIIDEYFVNWAEGFEDEDEEYPWKIEKPLIFDNCYPKPKDWICDACLTGPEEYGEQLAKREEQMALREAQEISTRLKRISDEREYLQRQLMYAQGADNHVIKAKAIVLLKSLGETEYIELFVISRHHSEPPYNKEEIYLKEGKYGGKILISEQPVTDNSKRNIYEFYKDWIKNKELLHQKVCHLTDWVTLSEFEKLTPTRFIPYQWKLLQGWTKIK